MEGHSRLTEEGSSEFQPFLSPYLRLGAIDEEIEKRLKKSFDSESFVVLAGKVRGVSIPVVVPFIGEGRTLIVSCDNRTRDDGLDLLQMFILRATALLGRQVKFTLLDPSGHGQAFPIQRFLQARSTGDDVNSDLKAVQQDIRRINQTVLTGEAGLHKLESPQLAGEPFEVVVAAGFPEGFDRRAVDTIYNLGKSGLRAGRYTIIHHDRSEPLPKELPIDGVENAFCIDPKEKYSTLPDFAFHFDKPPTISIQQKLLERIKEAGKVDHSLDWEGIVGLKPGEWWDKEKYSSAAMIHTPLGKRGGTDNAEFWLGQNDTRQAAHGVICGMPGSGKSTFYHGLIMGLAIRYSPAELHLYVIDLKQGVELRVYEKLPHVKVISLNTSAEMTLSILQDLKDEMVRRNNLFGLVGAEGLASYRKKGNAMPRMLLLIDEYHRLFEEQEIAATASAILAELAKLSRSAGIHMFLGSQQFNAPGMLNRAAIFENFHLKVAMQLQPATIAGLTEFGPIGKRLIRDITVPGKFVMTFSGKDDECITGQAAHLKDEKRNELIQKLRTKAGASAEPPQVFDGEAATAALENFALQEVLKQRAGLTPKALESLARRDVGKGGGFGLPRWVAGDRPVGLWLGRRFTVYGHAQAMLTRTMQQNLLMVGNSGEARAGMLTGMLISVATLYRPGEVAIDIVHAGGDDDDPTLAVCQTVVDHLLRAAGHSITFTREVNGVESLMAQYDAELATRKEKGAKDAPSRLLLIVEPDRVPVLRRSQDVMAKRTPQQERFRRLLEEGSQHGLHVVLMVNSFSLMNTTVDKKGLAVFAHRVGLQMSQDDSYSLFDNSKASSLQSAGSKVPVALYVNKETDEAVRFKPYAEPKPTELDRLARTLSKAFATPAGG